MTAAQMTLAGTVDRSDFPTGDVRVEVRSAAGAQLKVSAPLPTGAGVRAYSIPNVVAGTVYLRAWYDANRNGICDESDTSKLYWTAGGGTKNLPGTAIMVPLAKGDERFNFTNRLRS